MRAEQVVRDGADYLPYVGHVADDAVLLADGSLLGVLHATGRPFALETTETRYAQRRMRNHALRVVADDHIEITEHLVRHNRVAPPIPGRFRSAYAAHLAADYQTATLDSLRANDWFVSVLVRPRHLAHATWMKLRKSKGQSPLDPDLLLDLRDRLDVLEAAYARHGARRLGRRAINTNGLVFSEIAEALRLILYGQWQAVGEPAGPIGQAIYTDRIVAGRLGLHIHDPGGDRFGAILGFKEYPTPALPWILDALQDADFPLVMTNGFRFLGRARAEDRMALKQRQMENAGDRAVSLKEELDEAMDHNAVTTVRGSHHFSLAIYADDMATLRRRLSTATTILSEAGVRPSVEHGGVAGGLEPAVYAQLPGASGRFRTRPGGISAFNMASFSSLGGYPRGERAGHWGAALFRMATTAGTAFDLNLHVTDVPHSLLIGPTSSGKTTFMLFLLAMAEKVAGEGGTRILLDKDGGGEIFVRAANGHYTTIQRGEPSGLAPLLGLENSAEARSWLADFIAGLVRSDGGPSPDHTEYSGIQRGIAFMMQTDRRLRSIEGLREFMPKQGGTDAYGRLGKWCRGGSLGWAFDNDEDRLRFDGALVGIDNGPILTDDAAEVRAPIAAYQLFRIRQVADGRRLIVAVDEARAYLPDERFARGFEDFALTLRKKNGALLLATQQPEHFLSHPVGASLIANSPTRYLFANPMADEQAYSQGLGCTPGEYQAVRETMTAGPRSVLIKRDAGSVVCHFDLSALHRHIAVLSGRTSTVRLMHRCRAEVGDDPAAWLPLFHQRIGEAAA